MSGRSAKARRRELRRALGTEAVQHVDTVAQQLADVVNALNNQVIPNMNALTTATEAHGKSIRELKEQVESLRVRLQFL